MKFQITRTCRKLALAAAVPLFAVLSAPAAAQGMETVDPDAAIDADLMDGYQAPAQSQPADEIGGAWDGAYTSGEATPRYETADPADPQPSIDLPGEHGGYGDIYGESVAEAGLPQDYPEQPAQEQTTYAEDDLIGAAESLFGEGAEGLAMLVKDILKDQGEPNGYIVGREGGGAFIFGVRYGSGTLYHKVEGNMPVYWTGPSLGPDVGANAGNTFTLVYNLHDTDELYERYPAGEGQAYFVGGFTASYVRKGDVVLIPIRVGAGLRLGVNAGYMRFSREQRWLPF